MTVYAIAHSLEEATRIQGCPRGQVILVLIASPIGKKDCSKRYKGRRSKKK